MDAGHRSADSLQRLTTYRLPASGLVERAADGTAAVVQHVSVDHCRLDVAVAQKFLHRSYIVAAFEQMRGEGVPQTMGGRTLIDPRAPARLANLARNGPLVQMMAPSPTGPRIGRNRG
jgi:hypothetical protein